MKHCLIAILLLTSVAGSACTSPSRADAHSPVRRVIAFHRADARLAANTARAELGNPPMESQVELSCEPGTNSWTVTATEADMKRVEALASKLDHN